MTDTTDTAALREHNQHIVAHLTRSNPRGPLSSAEVLTLESAKLVVAALLVRDGLPDADHSEYWFEHEGKLLFDGALFNSRVAIFIDSQLEAERQRAAELQSTVNRLSKESNKLFDDRQRINKSWTEAETDNALLRDELAALKAKLANPVVLQDFHAASIQSTQPFNLFDVIVATQVSDAKAIRSAGFTVKGDL